MNGLRSVGSGWFVEYSQCSTLASQILVFDQPGCHSNYHRGQRSEYLINGVSRTVCYSDGDPERKPSKFIVNCASEALIQLNEEGKLFTLSEVEIKDHFKCLHCGAELTIADEGYGEDWGTCFDCTE
ncbi:MAG: hypothetical protein QM504_14270 [Pseudomonadota bacterium]